MTNAQELYQKVILEHHRHPRNFGELPEPRLTIERNNPICGDEVRLFVRLSPQNLLEKCTFTGRGCALSIAAASMLTELATGKSPAAVLAMIDRVENILRGNHPPEALDQYGDFGALKGVLDHPVRIKCVLLSWQALQELLEEVLD